MPDSSFSEHTQRILDIIDELLSTGQAVRVEQTIDQRSTLRGFVSGVLSFDDGSELHYREFVDASLPEPRLMYAYHYQNHSGVLVFRYDNAAHKPPLPQPEHKHSSSGIETSPAPTFESVIDEILG